MNRTNNKRVEFWTISNEVIELMNADDRYLIVYIPERTSELCINYEHFHVGESNIIFLSPGEVLFSKEKVKTCKVISFRKGSIPTSENLIYLLFNNSLQKSKELKFIHRIKKSNDGKIQTYMRKIEHTFGTNEASEEELFCQINNLIYECVYTILFGDHQDIIHFQELLNTKYTSKHLVSDYAEEIQLPPKELLRAFIKRGYENPSAVIKDRLVLEIKKRLVTTNLEVKQIALEMGFEDPAYFARFFRKNTGFTALQFRKKFVKKY